MLVDAATDADLSDLIDSVTSEVVSALASGGLSRAAGAEYVARLVSERLGGAIPYEQYEHYDEPASNVANLRASSGSRVVPLGLLTAGAARHRALLFKVLCDRCGIPVSYDSGRCTRGAHAYHSWNTMIVDGAVVVVDLIHQPGALYPNSSDEARQYKRIDEYAFSSLPSTFIKRVGPMPEGTVVDATSAKHYANELFPTGASPF